MNWEAHIVPNDGFQLKVYFSREVAGDEMEVMYPRPDHTWTIERVSRYAQIPASLTFDVRTGYPLLRSLAAALASHGFATLDPGGVVKAKDAHIASLEKELERLERVVMKTPFVVKGERLT